MNIKKLLINYADISATCLQYFSNKLGSLDKLQITGNSRHSTFNEELEWWYKLANLYLLLQKYNIRTDLTTLRRAELLLREIGSINTKKLTLLTSNAPSNIYADYNVVLTKDKNSLELLFNHFDIEQFAPSSVSTPLHLYYPIVIKIIAENIDKFYDRHAIRVPKFLSPATVTSVSRYITSEAITYQIR